jgi:PPOX class probable F420-dependent enzyme
VTRAVANRREQIRLTAAELEGFLAAQRVMSVCTNGGDGWPHVTALWYVMRGAEPWIYTYRKSQKVRNLERDPRCTVQVEAGEEYQELRGVMFKAECELVRELDAVAEIGAEIAARYGGAALTDDVRAAMRKQAAKRVGLHFVARQAASWDHRKLGGGY